VSPDRVGRVASAELAVGAVGVAANVSQRVLPSDARLAAALGAAGTAVVIARRAGVSWSELGLGRDRVADGVRWGAAAGAAIAVGIGVAGRFGAVRERFSDDRVATHDRVQAAYELAVRIPLETALAEEVIFRGALLGLALGRRSTPAALVTTSALFGLWHVLPTWAGMDGSAVGASVGEGPAARVGAVAGVVAATACAGAAFGFLRLRSGSLVAPVVAHSALNMTSFAVARSAARHRSRSTQPQQGGRA